MEALGKNNIIPGIMLAGTGLDYSNKMSASRNIRQQGYDVQAGQEASAAADVVNAGQKRAEGQRNMAVVGKQGKLAESALRARAAAQPGGMASPTTVNIAGDLAAEVQYRKNAALFEGESYAKALQDRANMSRWTGQQYAKAGEIKAKSARMSALSSLLGGMAQSSAFAKWGDKPAKVAPDWVDPDKVGNPGGGGRPVDWFTNDTTAYGF
jgi:hypothetical protein